MTQKILGPEGSKRRKRFWLVPMVAALFAVVFYVAGAQAVHDAGIFQLDKNASTAVNPPPTAAEDWDLICKAHPTTCTFAAGYPVPAGTTTSDPSQFKVDPSESSQDDILKGGTKDDNEINSWSWASAKPSPPKNDITDGYAAEYTATVAQGGVSVGDKILYFGADRFSNSGSANIAFWFFQKQVATAGASADGSCPAASGCPFSGTHTAGNVSLGGTTPGDILVISAFGPKAAINIYEWVGAGNATSPCFTSTCTLQPILTGGQACEDVTNDNACATVNDVSVPSPWAVNQKTGGANQFAPTNFFEGGINLTKLKIDACISSFLINTRASAAGNAELHDLIIGQFDRCVPTTTTQASTNGTVQPGTGVHDTATVTVTGAASPDDATGTVNFFLCGPNAVATACTTGGTAAGSGTLADTSSPANAHDGISGTVSSPDVNTAAAPLANGYYCFRAEADLTNYDDPDPATNATTECFQVLQLATTTVTSPQAPAGTNVSGPVALNTSVFDHAVVTGSAAGGFPEGTVSFFICNPSQVAGGVCPESVTGNQVGSAVTVTHVANETFKSEATSSPAVVANQVGVWCFRAVFTPSGSIYTGSGDATSGECFTVRTNSSATSVQKWLPNDSVTITSGVPLTGTLSITLRSGSCLGNVVYTEPTNTTLNGVASGTTFDTTNSNFFVNAGNAGTYFWRAVYTPTSSFVDGVTKCETSTVSVNNNP